MPATDDSAPPESATGAERLEVAHVLFMDLVGYSRLVVEEQSRRIGALQDIVRETAAYTQAKGEASVLAHPAGDGMALAFFGDPSSPARCALQVAEAARGRDDLPLRMGIHSGPIHRAEDISDTPNVRGPGINLAQRVMDCGDPGHILLSYMTAEALIESEAWKPRLHDLGEVEVKHGIRIRIYSLAADGAAEPQRPAKVVELAAQWAAEHRTHNLPASLTSFVGREGQIDEVKERLRETRLLTLTGTGGTGKTRLSLRVGEELLAEYPDGVWFIELASISDADLIVDAVAAVLDVRDSAEQTLMTTLTRYLTGQQTLIILDNCEHLVEGAATFAQDFLTACSGPRILATSREVLGVNGEATWRVPSLSLPNQDDEPDGGDLTHFEAVRLFVDRARAAQSDFAVTEENAPAVAAICRRLDGIPLAIELAAARVRAMSVEQIHDRLDERFRLLTGGGRASPRRQQTLRALVDWSYRLLDEPQQALFARLSVFAGGFTMEAAEDVYAFGGVESWDVLDLLLQLVDKSLVIVEEGPTGPRYRMLETLREYGLERIYDGGDADEVRNRHAAYFGKFVTEHEADFQGLRQLEAFDIVEGEADNIRQALSWSMDEDSGIALHLVADLGWYWNERGHWLEAREWQRRCWGRCQGIRSSAMAWMLARKSFCHAQYLEGEAAQRDAEEALRMATESGDKTCAAWSLISLGYAHQVGHSQLPRLQRSEVAETSYRAALEMFDDAGDRSGVASALVFLAASVGVQGDLANSRLLAREATRITHEAGPPMIASAAAYLLGIMEYRAGNFTESEAGMRTALSLARKVRNLDHERSAMEYLGLIAAVSHDDASAYAYYNSCTAIGDRVGRRLSRYAVRSGACACRLGRLDAARVHWEEALTLFAGSSSDHETSAMQTLLALADLDLLHGHLDSAGARLQRAVAVATRREPAGVVACLDGCARLQYARGHVDLGVRLLAVGAPDRATALDGHRLHVSRILAESADALTEQARQALGAERFNALFDEGRALTLEEAVADVHLYLGLPDDFAPDQTDGERTNAGG